MFNFLDSIYVLISEDKCCTVTAVIIKAGFWAKIPMHSLYGIESRISVVINDSTGLQVNDAQVGDQKVPPPCLLPPEW